MLDFGGGTFLFPLLCVFGVLLAVVLLYHDLVSKMFPSNSVSIEVLESDVLWIVVTLTVPGLQVPCTTTVHCQCHQVHAEV